MKRRVSSDNLLSGRGSIIWVESILSSLSLGLGLRLRLSLRLLRLHLRLILGMRICRVLCDAWLLVVGSGNVTQCEVWLIGYGVLLMLLIEIGLSGIRMMIVGWGSGWRHVKRILLRTGWLEIRVVESLRCTDAFSRVKLEKTFKKIDGCAINSESLYAIESQGNLPAGDALGKICWKGTLGYLGYCFITISG